MENIKENIAKLEKGLDNPYIAEDIKAKIREKLIELKSELEKPLPFVVGDKINIYPHSKEQGYFDIKGLEDSSGGTQYVGNFEKDQKKEFRFLPNEKDTIYLSTSPTIDDLTKRLVIANKMAKKDPALKARVKIVEKMIEKARNKPESKKEMEIKKWYQSEFPSDELGEEISNKATFKDLEKDITKVYDIIEVSDSVIRERIFEELAKRMGVDYSVVYNKWLGNEKDLKPYNERKSKTPTIDDLTKRLAIAKKMVKKDPANKVRVKIIENMIEKLKNKESDFDKEVTDFIQYVKSFYGKNGVYAKDYNGGFTQDQIEEAVVAYINDVNTNWGGGDSVDRELVRDKFLAPITTTQNITETIGYKIIKTLGGFGDGLSDEKAILDSYSDIIPQLTRAASEPVDKEELKKLIIKFTKDPNVSSDLEILRKHKVLDLGSENKDINDVDDEIKKAAEFYFSDKYNLTKYDLYEDLVRYVQMEKDFNAKKLTPKDIIGTGHKPQYAREIASKWIKDRLELTKYLINNFDDKNKLTETQKQEQPAAEPIKELYLKEIAERTALRKEAIQNFATANGLTNDNMLDLIQGLGSKIITPIDLSTAISGTKGNAYEVNILNWLKNKPATEKLYYTQNNIGKAKYVVNYHDGVKTHKDGGAFYDIKIFKNKKDFENFIKKLESEGYKEKYEKGGETDIQTNSRMYNFLKDDLEKLEKAINEDDKEQVETFFSYWNHHLDKLRTETNDRMYNFLKDDLEKLETAINEDDKEETERFFSYWNHHLESLKMEKGGEISANISSIRGLIKKAVDGKHDRTTVEKGSYKIDMVYAYGVLDISFYFLDYNHPRFNPNVVHYANFTYKNNKGTLELFDRDVYNKKGDRVSIKPLIEKTIEALNELDYSVDEIIDETEQFGDGGGVSLKLDGYEYQMISSPTMNYLKKSYNEELKNKDYAILELPSSHPDRKRGNKFGLFKKPKMSNGGELNEFIIGEKYKRDSGMGGTYTFEYRGMKNDKLNFKNTMHKDYGGGEVETYTLQQAQKTFVPQFKNGGQIIKRRTNAELAQAKYNEEVDAYKWYLVNVKEKHVISGFEFKEDATDLLADYDGDKNYKVVSKKHLEIMGIENPNEAWKKMEKGGVIEMSFSAKEQRKDNFKVGDEVWVWDKNSAREAFVYNVDYVDSKKIIGIEFSHSGIKEYVPINKIEKFKNGGSTNNNTHVVVSKTKDDYWVVSSTPMVKTKAEQFKKLITPAKGETLHIETVEAVKKHKKVIGDEYLAKGGEVSGFKYKVGQEGMFKGGDYEVLGISKADNNYILGESGDIFGETPLKKVSRTELEKNFTPFLKKGGSTWIQSATKQMEKKGTKGLFTERAEARGLKPVEFAKKVLENPKRYTETIRKEAQFVKNTNPELFK